MKKGIKKLVFIASTALSVSAIIPAAQAGQPGLQGLYAGINLGQRTVDADWETTQYRSPTGFTQPMTTNSKASLDGSATSFGGFVGYNWLLNEHLLVGVEGQINSASNKESSDTIPGTTASPFSNSSIESETTLDGNIRGRVGYVINPRMHVYGALGIAAISAELSMECRADNIFCAANTGTKSDSTSKTLTGWSAGIGFEAALTDLLLLRIEYNVADYGTLKHDGLPAIPGASFGAAGEADYKSSAIQLGLGFSF